MYSDVSITGLGTAHSSTSTEKPNIFLDFDMCVEGIVLCGY